MGLSNMYLMALLEAAKDKEKKKKSDTPEGDQTDAPETTAEEDTTAEGDTDETEETSDEGSPDDNTTDEPEPDNENPDEEGQQENENPEENQGEGEGESDFSLDSDAPGGDADSEPPPDGLVDPDDDGSGDPDEDPDGETNVHVNILNLSKLDRSLAKRKCLTDYYDLRTSIDTFRNIIDRNEAAIEPEVRSNAIDKLNKLYTTVSEYLMYKFSISNYEDTLQHYFLFMKALNDIVADVKENGLNSK